MSKAIAVGIVAVSVSFAMLAFGYLAGTSAQFAPVPHAVAAQPTAGTSLNRAEVEQIVRDYLLSNPEILLEAQEVLEARRADRERTEQQDFISSAGDRLFRSEHDGIYGNPEGSVTVVEFFDYNCGYCKRALEDMEALVASDPEVRFVLKEFPILGPDSQRAHVVSMAFHALNPDAYGDFHRSLMTAGGRATEASAIRVALEHGVDEAALREEMLNPRITAAFSETYELANRLSITGTPSYVIGNEVVFGARGINVLAQKVELARACGDETC